MCRQEEQWQAVAWRGREVRGTAVVKWWELQRQRAVRVRVSAADMVKFGQTGEL